MIKEVEKINISEIIEDNKNIAMPVSVDKIKSKEYQYSIEISSGADVVIKKKTSRTTTYLALLATQGIMYIYDEKNNTKKEIKTDTILKNFFNNKVVNDIVLEEKYFSYLSKDIRKSELTTLFNLFKYIQEFHCLREIIRKQIYAFAFNSFFEYRLKSSLLETEELFIKNKNMFSILKNYTGKEIPNGQDLNSFLNISRTIQCLIDDFGVDNTKYFIENVENVHMVLLDSQFMHFGQNIKQFNLDFKRAVEYFYTDIPKQGYTKPPFITYKDTMECQRNFYGKIKNKYPKYLETEHDFVVNKINEKQNIKEYSEEFINIMENVDDYSYKNRTDQYIILMPEKPEDLIEEGSFLQHCVAVYVPKVAKEECVIVFMREYDMPEVPYLTIEISPNKEIIQIEGMNKRHELLKDEIEFIKKWADKKDLKICVSEVNDFEE